MPVLGIGGFFWRAKDPEALKSWYRDVLGVGAGFGTDAEGKSSDWFWHPEPGPVVFEPFKDSTDYFAADRQFMLNLRVRDLDSLLEQLNASGVAVITKAEWDSPETGRFARIHDPEGTPIELWEPPAE
ncbi:VOC family protein [Sphingomonas sp. HF-S3]|uniref:VOC family protein n=1 Tax=Sphingomonas rustica TaxID=3103142 RepID=A0ABV0BDL2_9SPHN